MVLRNSFQSIIFSGTINKFLKEKTAFSRESYNKQRNYCVKLIRQIKIKYFGNLNVNNIKLGPNFSSKKPMNENISLWEKID